MFPLQTLSDPAIAVVSLSALMILVVVFGFIWAYQKIAADPAHDSEGTGPGGHSA